MLVQIRSGDVPKLIRQTAEELAGAFYDMTRTERFRQQAGTQRRFVRNHWKDHIPVTLEILASLLAEPGRDEREKEEIYDAITTFHEKASRGTPNLSMRSLQ